MREAIDGSSTSHTQPRLKIHKHKTAGKREAVPSAIATYLKKKEQLQEEQRSRKPTETEDELRERLKKLEQQLASLQQKLEANNAANAAPMEQPRHIETTAKYEEAAGKSEDMGSTPASAGPSDK